MSKSKVIILSGFVSLLLIGGALIFVMQSGRDADNSNSSQDAKNSATTSISSAELAKNDGKNGNKCWVAVDGTVYEIPADSPLWRNGEHSESEGQAFCGLDMSEVIKLSPHGKTKLATLDKVGIFSP